MESSGTIASRATLTHAAALGWDALRAQVAQMLGDDAHKKTVDAATSVVAGIVRAGTVALATIATMIAAVHGLLPKAAFQRLDRIVANPRLDLRACGAAWVAFVLGDRRDVLVALDWTDFDADDHATIVASVITQHGRATPLWWRTVPHALLTDGGRADEEDQLLLDLRAALPPGVRVRLLADRGFADQKLIALLTSWGWGYVIRIRQNIYVTDATGRRRTAGAWVRGDGRALRLVGATITAAATPVGSFVAVHHRGMKEPWLLVCDAVLDDTREIIALYDRRFSIEETFRDQQDPRFGLGLDQVRIGTPEKRDRLLLLAAMAQALLTLLGAAGEACGLDKGLSKTGVKRRVYSLFRQGTTWFVLLPTMRPDRRERLMTAFEDLIRQHHALSELLGFL
jgi:hypothetical protein